MRTMKLSGVLGAVACLAVQMLVGAAPAAAYTVAGCSTVAGPPVIGQQRSDRDESTDGRSATCSVAFNGANGFGESSSTPGVLRNAASTSFAAGSYASARARGEWRDQVTIVGPTFVVTGRPGRVYFDWGIEGRLEATGDASAAVFARLMAGPLNQGFRVLGQASRQLNTPGQVKVEAGGRGVELFFVFDQPFEVLFEVDVTAVSPNSFPVHGSLTGGSANARFGSTAWWGGISRVEDEFGNALDVQVATDSGLNLLDSLQPAVPVPEPAAILLWLLGAVMLLARRWLPLALALFGTAVQAQQVGVSGRLTGSLNGESFDDIEYSQASHTLAQSDGVQAQRNLQDPAVAIDDWAVAGGQSLAHAGFGWLGVQVGAEVGVGVLAGSGAIQASARAQFTDLLTITPTDPALLGTWGRFSYTVVLSGNGGIDDASSNGYGEVIYGGLGLPSGGWISSAQGQGKGAPIGSPLPVVVTFESFTRFGAPTFIELRLDAELQVLVYQGRVDAFADLMHTAAWGGIASVSTLDGQLLAPDRYALASASGTDYRSAITAVPELPPALLLALGLMALGLRKSWCRTVS